MKRIIEHAIIILVIVIGIFSYTAYRAYAKLDRHVSAGKDTPAKYDLTFQNRYFTTSDGVKIASWYIPVKNPKAFVILVHGFQSEDGGKAIMLTHAAYLHDAGYSTLLLDLRSVGYSQGTHVSLGVNEWKDVEAAYDYVHTMPESRGKKIGFLGNSMGAATTIIQKGITGKGDFIIASVPYANFKTLFTFQIAREGLPPVVFYPFLRVSALPELGFHYAYYSPINWAANIHSPTLLISAAHDEEVDSRDAKLLFDKIAGPKEYWQADSGHDVYHDQPQQFESKVLSFLAKVRS